MNKQFKFEPSDFSFGEDGSPLEEAAKLFNIHQEAAHIANRLLDNHLTSLTKVYLHSTYSGHDNISYIQTPDSSLTAVLFNPNEIPKQECKHLIVEYNTNIPIATTGRCGVCKKELKATWSACE